jgi:sigma-E factor negative regulatory protein RseC
MSGEISHKGIIKEFSKKGIIVGIIAESACATCHAKGACSASDMTEKEIEIDHDEGEFQVGQHVVVTGKTSQGFKALFLAYLLPFILVMAVLIVSSNFTGNEGLSGLLSLGILIPYYLILYLFRNRLKRSFDFEIEPLQ